MVFKFGFFEIRAEKGRAGSKGSTPSHTPRGLGSSWGQASPSQQASKTPTVKTVLQDMKKTEVYLH